VSEQVAPARVSLRRVFVLVARGALVVAGALPFLPALFERLGANAAAHALDVWFRFQCERDPARMLAVGAACARCVGLYVGLGAGALVARPRLERGRLELWLGVAVAAMLLDVASESLGFRPAWAPLRVVTGLGLGYPAGVAVVRALTAWVNGAAPASAPVSSR
jgi:uncharacterized membrane protein